MPHSEAYCISGGGEGLPESSDLCVGAEVLLGQSSTPSVMGGIVYAVESERFRDIALLSRLFR